MSRFPELEDMTVEFGLAWCLAAFAFFEEACRSGDKDQLWAAGTIGYGLHNLPKLMRNIQGGKPSLTCAYGDMSHRLPGSQARALTRQFFKQNIPAVTLPEERLIPASLENAIYSTMQAFRLGFRPSSVFATDEGTDERRQACLNIALVMRAHLQQWIDGGEFDADAFQKDGGWL